MCEASDKSLEAISDSSHKFGLKLYKFLRETPGNVFYSPISLEVVLSLVHFGAKGITAEEIISALLLPKEVDTVKKGFNMIMTNLKSTDNMTLEIANKVYSDNTFSIEQEFNLVAEKFFLASAENVDFRGSSDSSRVTMNSWVEKQTHDKIKNLFGEGDITSDTRMVLINAVYFKGSWSQPFDPANTKKEPFHISATESKEVDMMHVSKKFGYLELEDLKAKMLVMPYVGDQMFMVILLPNAIDGLKEMEQKLHTVNIVDLMKKTSKPEVEVALPRFKIENTMDLKETLQKMGIKSMFDETADFSGLSKEKGLYVSKVVQKAFIEVNEEGSEAAAATAARVRGKRSAQWVEEFVANHPFVFHLYSNTGVAVFCGVVGVEAEDKDPPDIHVEL